MPDVGVLNLQIQDNSEQAATGLGNLADALGRVRDAVQGGLRLTTVANQIKKVADAVNQNVNESMLGRLRQLGESLGNLQGLGNINIRFNSSGEIREIRDTMNNTRISVDGISSGFEQVGQRVVETRGFVDSFNSSMRETVELMQSKAWTGGFEQFQKLLNGWLRMRSAMALGPGTAMSNVAEETGWTYWKDGAIEVEGVVCDVTDNINERLEGTQLRLNGIVGGSLEKIINSVGWLGESLRGLNGVEAQMQAIEMVANGTGMDPDEVRRQLTELSNGFLQFGEAAARVVDSGDMEQFRQQMDEIVNSSMDGVSKLDLLRQKAEILNEQIARREEILTARGMDPFDDRQLVNYRLQVIAINEQIQKLSQSLIAAANVNNPLVNMQRDYGGEMVENLVNNYSEIDLLTMKMNGMQQALADDINQNKVDTQAIAERVMAIQKLRDKIEELSNAQKEASKNTVTISGLFGRMKSGIERMFPTLTGMIKRFGQIAKYRMIRAVLKHITEGFKEGLENVYHYSKAVGTSFAPAMDSAASALLQMKNSLGAALAPVLQALIPVLQTVVNWFINLVNYANQFFSLLTGQSEWTRAIPATAEAFADTAKNAGSAGKKIKEAKDLLADWDELNIIQQEASDNVGGSGSGAKKTAEDYKNMFEQVGSFSEGVERLVNFIEDHLGGVLGLAGTIGAVILGWKISKAFEGVLGRIGKLIAGGALLVLGVELSYGAGFEAGKKGYFDGTDILTTLGGWLSSALGGYLIGTSIAGPGGGLFGAVIGLTIGIAATLVGWIQGKERGRRESMWGDLSKTRDEIEGDVKSQFTFDVEAEINVMKAHVAKQAEARRNIRIAFNQFSASVQNLKVGIDVGIDVNKQEELVNQAYTDYLTLCSDLQNMITTRQEGVDLLVKTFKFTDSEGNDITQSTIESLKFADKTVMDYFTDLGDEMAGWIYKGEQSGWKNREAEQIYALMESQRNIVARAEEARLDQEKKTKIKTGLYGVVDLDTAETTFEVQKQYLKDWENEAKQLVDAEIADAAYMAELAHGAWEDAVSKYGIDSEQARELKAAEQRNLAFIEQMSNEDEYRKAINAKLEPTKKVFAEEWASTLRTVFGEKIDFNVDLLNGINLKFTSLLEGRTTQQAGLQFRKYIEDYIGDIDPLLKNVMTEFGIDTWDMIGDEAKKSMIQNLLGIADENQVKEILTYAFGNLTDETKDLIHQTAEEMKNLAATEAEASLSGFTSVLDDKKRKKLTAPMQRFSMLGADVLEMGRYGFSNIDSFRDWERNGMPGREERLNYSNASLALQGISENAYRRSINAIAALKAMDNDGGWSETLDKYLVSSQRIANGQQASGEEGISSDVEKGVKAGNTDQNDLIRQLVTIATQIANKQWTVNLNASSAMGSLAARSIDQFNRVRGEG